MRGLIGAGLVLLAAAPLVLTAYEEGPLPGFTGGFGEQSCTACHFDHPVNDPGGSLELAGVPVEFAPRQQYSITVSVRRPELTRAGFELSARYSAGSHRGEDAGVLTPPDERTRVVTSAKPKHAYIQHTKLGAQAATPGGLSWTFLWTAPPRPSGPVAFSVAANATNANGSPSGDFVYTSQGNSRLKLRDR